MHARTLIGVLATTACLGMAEARVEAPPVLAQAQSAKPPAPATAPSPPEILYDLSRLPAPVRRMRERLIEAARSGDIEQLRPVIESNEMPPSFTLDTTENRDPIEVLKEALDDKAGQEILATLLEVMEAGFVHVDVGTPQEMWVWPYFAHVPLDTLTPAQKVELFRIVTSFDYEQMRQVDAYIFYRVGIGPDGTWHHFVAGE